MGNPSRAYRDRHPGEVIAELVLVELAEVIRAFTIGYAFLSCVTENFGCGIGIDLKSEGFFSSLLCLSEI